MTLNQMSYFQTVAREGHMGRSAEKLLIAQPSLSVSMMKLEEELGVTLFDRHGHSLILTAEGKIFLRHVDRILEVGDIICLRPNQNKINVFTKDMEQSLIKDVKRYE